jgi:hypothetical protein
LRKVNALIDAWSTGTNAGLLLRTATEGEAGILFNSSEIGSAPGRPELVISFTPVPEPALGLIMLGITIVSSRRRRHLPR